MHKKIRTQTNEIFNKIRMSTEKKYFDSSVKSLDRFSESRYYRTSKVN